MNETGLARRLAAALPFYYGWVILAVVCCTCFSRAGPAVATLSIFLAPMTTEFGWSRTALSGAVSLGGLLAAVSSPLIGSFLDKRGARLVLCLAVITTFATLTALSQIQSIVAFYLLFCIARLNFAGPFDLGIYGAVNSWFVARRAMATSIVTLAQMISLILMPLIGYAAIAWGGWRIGWLAVGAATLIVGLLPSWLLLIRAPEDVGLKPDGGRAQAATMAASATAPVIEEPAFSRAQALRTRAFWTLALYTALIYPVQAGMSLHQASHLIERGVGPGTAATAVSLFSLASAVTGFGYGFVARWLSVKLALAAAALLIAASALLATVVVTAAEGIAAGVLFGLGIGAVHTILPIAWADYFGRRSFGAIRGVALTVQVVAQASGPLLSGILRDLTGDYVASLVCFTVLSGAGLFTALLTRAPAGRPSTA